MNLVLAPATEGRVDKENARRHYLRALQMGVSRNFTLENLLGGVAPDSWELEAGTVKSLHILASCLLLGRRRC